MGQHIGRVSADRALPSAVRRRGHGHRPLLTLRNHPRTAGEALRASAAIPGVFLHVQCGGHVLVDGGVASLVPVRAARALGADVVIAVDIYCNGPRYPSKSAMSMWLRVSQTQSCLLSGPETASADVLIAPAIISAGPDDAAGREAARQQGYEAAVAALPTLSAALRHHGVGS